MLSKCQIVYFSRENRVFPLEKKFVGKYAILALFLHNIPLIFCNIQNTLSHKSDYSTTQ